MKVFLIFILVVVAVIFGMRFYASNSRKSLDELKKEVADTNAYYENQKATVKKIWEAQDKLDRLKGNQ